MAIAAPTNVMKIPRSRNEEFSGTKRRPKNPNSSLCEANKTNVSAITAIWRSRPAASSLTLVGFTCTALTTQYAPSAYQGAVSKYHRAVAFIIASQFCDDLILRLESGGAGAASRPVRSEFVQSSNGQLL